MNSLWSGPSDRKVSRTKRRRLPGADDSVLGPRAAPEEEHRVLREGVHRRDVDGRQRGAHREVRRRREHVAEELQVLHLRA